MCDVLRLLAWMGERNIAKAEYNRCSILYGYYTL